MAGPRVRNFVSVVVRKNEKQNFPNTAFNAVLTTLLKLSRRNMYDMYLGHFDSLK